MIIDTCIFSGEIEMLEFRMAILGPVVDHFIVVENTYTHQGEKRECSIIEPTNRVTTVLTDFYSNDPRSIETSQRDSIKDACSRFDDSDIVILSDVDEIPSRESVIEAQGVLLPRTCDLDFFYYRLNYLRPENCSLMISTVGHLRKIGGQLLRDLRGSIRSLKNKGWHLSYFGGTTAIQKKLRTFCHSEFNTPEFLDEHWLEECQREGKALLKCGTTFSRVGKGFFPDYLIEAAPKYWWL